MWSKKLFLINLRNESYVNAILGLLSFVRNDFPRLFAFFVVSIEYRSGSHLVIQVSS